jgi:HPt (histidine-containing phosphotransfer) domain-containing protein
LAGFLEVVPKPVSVVVLQATVRRLLGRNEAWVREPGPGKQPLWDESQALAAIGGNRSSLVALRKIFLAELPSMREEIAAAQSAGNADAVRNLLHKLKAGCGFVGATRLGGAVEMLAATPLDVHALRRLEFAASDVLAWRDDQS